MNAFEVGISLFLEVRLAGCRARLYFTSFVTLSLGLEEVIIILTVSCQASSAIPVSTYTRIHITVLETIRIRRKFENQEKCYTFVM